MIGKFVVGVAMILEQNGTLLIGKRSTNKFGAGLWEFPSGRLEEGENPYEGIIREGKEELNLELNPVQIIDAYSFKRETDDLLLLNILCEHQGELLKSHEHDELRWIEIDKVREYFSFDDQKVTVNRLVEYFKLVQK
jgi:8-oxo-dGTP diphosphatase